MPFQPLTLALIHSAENGDLAQVEEFVNRRDMDPNKGMHIMDGTAAIYTISKVQKTFLGFFNGHL